VVQQALDHLATPPHQAVAPPAHRQAKGAGRAQLGPSLYRDGRRRSVPAAEQVNVDQQRARAHDLHELADGSAAWGVAPCGPPRRQRVAPAAAVNEPDHGRSGHEAGRRDGRHLDPRPRSPQAGPGVSATVDPVGAGQHRERVNLFGRGLAVLGGHRR
jgi:hypothetical protein